MHRLIRVVEPAQWRDLHAIRREVLFDTGVFPFRYDENHPDDRLACNTPFLLTCDDTAVGTARLDRRDAVGIVRLVGISSTRQRQGHGRALSRLIDREAAVNGMTTLCVNAFVEAIGFYERTGWQHAVWDTEELARLNGRGSQMIKRLAP